MKGLHLVLLILGIVTVFVIIPIIVILVLISKSGACYNSSLGSASCTLSSKKDCKGTYFDTMDKCKDYMNNMNNINGACYTDNNQGYGCGTSTPDQCTKLDGTYFDTYDSCQGYMNQKHPDNPPDGACYTDDGNGKYGCASSTQDQCDQANGKYFDTSDSCQQYMNSQHPKPPTEDCTNDNTMIQLIFSYGNGKTYESNPMMSKNKIDFSDGVHTSLTILSGTFCYPYKNLTAKITINTGGLSSFIIKNPVYRDNNGNGLVWFDTDNNTITDFRLGPCNNYWECDDTKKCCNFKCVFNNKMNTQKYTKNC